MSNIDSGLGWSCDSDYYVGTAGTLVTYPNGTITKSNSGGCIAGTFYNPSSNAYGLVMISTVRDNIITSCTASSFGGSDSIGSVTVDGIVWYIVHIWNSSSSYASVSSYLSDYSMFSFNAQTASLEERVRDILSEADVQSAALKIPTADFIKLFIEGVEAETATRVNSLYGMIAPAFSTSVSYSADDIVIYGNKLWKCTASHPAGAWDPADFSEISVAEMLGS